MPRPEFEEPEIWERLYAAEESQLATKMKEHSRIEGEDGELEFDRRVVGNAKNKDVIDIGCGTGEFTLEIARVARRVVGIDFSNKAISRALENKRSKRIKNVEFRYSGANNLPFPDGSFDLAVSRRGPALDTIRSITEACRVLRKDGELFVQEIGERDKGNWAQLFGRRGQMYPAKEKISVELTKRLGDGGFRNIKAEEFEANEYFATIEDVLMRMENSPIIPDFNGEDDIHLVHEIAKRFATPKGIQTNSHRVLIRAVK